MTTWKEAFTAYRTERTEAEKLKEIRDRLIRRLDLRKSPVLETRGAHINKKIRKF